MVGGAALHPPYEMARNLPDAPLSRSTEVLLLSTPRQGAAAERGAEKRGVFVCRRLEPSIHRLIRTWLGSPLLKARLSRASFSSLSTTRRKNTIPAAAGADRSSLTM